MCTLQLLEHIDSPLMLLFDPTSRDEARDIPVKVFEGVFNEGTEAGGGRFVQLPYAIETGEAERIAVEGVSKGGTGQGDESVGELNKCLLSGDQLTRPSRWYSDHAEERYQDVV